MLGLYGTSSIFINIAMKIIAKCDKCNSSFSVEEKFIGRKAKCSKCGEAFIVQSAKDAVAPENTAESRLPLKKSAGRNGRREHLFHICCPACL